MAFLIHHRIINGEKKYRLWSTVTDDYVTEELSVEEIKNLTIEIAIRSATEAALDEFPRRLERAHRFGSSSAIDSGVPLDGPWKERPKWEEELAVPKEHLNPPGSSFTSAQHHPGPFKKA